MRRRALLASRKRFSCVMEPEGYVVISITGYDFPLIVLCVCVRVWAVWDGKMCVERSVEPSPAGFVQSIPSFTKRDESASVLPPVHVCGGGGNHRRADHSHTMGGMVLRRGGDDSHRWVSRWSRRSPKGPATKHCGSPGCVDVELEKQT